MGVVGWYIITDAALCPNGEEYMVTINERCISTPKTREDCRFLSRSIVLPEKNIMPHTWKCLDWRVAHVFVFSAAPLKYVRFSVNKHELMIHL